MNYIQELDHQRERVQKTPMTGASYESHHVDMVVVVEVMWEETARTHIPLDSEVGGSSLC